MNRTLDLIDYCIFAVIIAVFVTAFYLDPTSKLF